MSEFDDLLDHLEAAEPEQFEASWTRAMSDPRVVESFEKQSPEEQDQIKAYVHQWWLDHNKAQFAILIVDEATREVIEKYRSMFEDIPGWSE
jgi:hypothetical protein